MRMPDRRCMGLLDSLSSHEKRPTLEQHALLQCIVDRIAREAEGGMRELASSQITERPLLDMVHGIPGAGKSALIEWTREAFGTIGWAHGVQYVFLAY